MKKTHLILLVSFLYCASPNAANLLIEHVTVLSPEKSAPLSDRYVLIRDDRIADISDHPITTDAMRLDGTGKFLTPGLMDSHVHVSSVPGIELDDTGNETLVRAYRVQQPRSYLYFGVTQVVDLNGTADGIAAFEGQPRHPDLFRCGGAPARDGYPSVYLPESVRYQAMPNYIVEGQAEEAAADHGPEAVVARIADSGAICVKLFIEDGFGAASNWPILSVATMKRVRDAAHKRGLLVVAHANALDMQRLAVEAGVDVLAHGLWNWGIVANDDAMPAEIAAHLRNVHAANIGWQATLRVLPGQRDIFIAGTLDDPVYRKVVPPPLLAWYRTDAAQQFKRELRRDYGGAADAQIAQIQWRIAERDLRATQFLYELGHSLLLGSDTPSAPTYGNQPGYDTFREMQLMAQARIAPADIFAAGTINNARQFGIEKDYGSIEVGKIANLLLLNANPMESVDAWNQIDKVILRGEPIDRSTFAADHPM